MSSFKQAKRQNKKLRVALEGLSGSGKTFTSLRLGFALVKHGLAKNVAVIDSENGSCEFYQGENPDGVPFEFAVSVLRKYGPDMYTAKMNEAIKEGFDCVIVDSLSHAWIGDGGALDLVGKSSDKNKFSAWKDVTPLHRTMVDTIINSNAHMICTVRSKKEYVMEADERGKMVPKEIGFGAQQREGMEYEFDLYATIEKDTHLLKVSKTRCSLMNGLTAYKPGYEFWAPMFDWMQSGAPSDATAWVAPVMLSEEEAKAMFDAAKNPNELAAAVETMKNSKVTDEVKQKAAGYYTEARTRIREAQKSAEVKYAEAKQVEGQQGQ